MASALQKAARARNWDLVLYRGAKGALFKLFLKYHINIPVGSEMHQHLDDLDKALRWPPSKAR